MLNLVGNSSILDIGLQMEQNFEVNIYVSKMLLVD